MLDTSNRFRSAIVLAILSALILFGSTPAFAADLHNASVSGKVSVPAGVDISSVRVRVAGPYDSHAGSGQLRADGTYTVGGLPEGRYKVQFLGGESNWYKTGTSFSTATVITLAAGQEVGGIDATLLKAASISGKITTPAGVTLVLGSVTLLNAATNYGIATSEIASDGTYRFDGLREGRYKIESKNSGFLTEWYNNSASVEAASVIRLSSGQDLAGIDMALQAGASIAGRVTVPSGVSLLPGVTGVTVVKAADSSFVASSSVKGDGTYRVGGLPEGSYKLEFRSYNSGAMNQWYNNATTFATATALTLAANQNLTGIDATLVMGGSIAGSITAPAGIDLSFVQLLAKTTDNSRAGYSMIKADGTYKISGLPAGIYKIEFVAYESGAMDQWYKNATSFEAATPVTLAAGQALVGINDTLNPDKLIAPVPTITGTAKVDSTLTAVPGTWAPAPVALAYQWYANGAAILSGTASTYKVGAADTGKTITVTVTGTKDGYTRVAKTSAATAVVAGLPRLTAPAPTITGTAKVDSTLTAVPGTWGPAPVILTYQWYAGGTAIPGASTSTYKVVGHDVGKALTVTVTGSKAGYPTVAKTAGNSAAVPSPVPIQTLVHGFNGGGKSGVLARDSAGVLWFYPGDGTGSLLARSRIGSGWNIMTSIVGTGDLNSDGKADVLARDSAGVLWFYPGNGTGSLLARTRIGKGWNIMTSIVGTGDLNSDGKADVLARDSAGVLWFYPGNGAGSLLARTRIGSGWNIMTSIVGTGDLNSDGKADVLARDSAGVLWFYPGNGTGSLLPRTRIGSGWNIEASTL